MTVPPPYRGSGPGRPPAGGKLPVGETVRQGYGLIGRHRDDLLRLGALPVFASLVIDVIAFRALSRAPGSGALEAPAGTEGDPVAPAMPDPALFLILLGVVPMTLFAVGWLRVLLRGSAAVPGIGLRWGRRETRFLMLGIGISLIAALSVAFPLAVVFAFAGGAPALLPLVFGLAMLGYLYILLRLSFALVAVVLDETCSFAESWAATKGESGRFLLIVVLAALPFELAATLLPALFGAIGLSAAAPFASLLVGVVLGYMVSAAALAAIALVYRRLRGPMPPSAALPA